MRTSIKLVSLAITVAIFLVLNLFWWIALPKGTDFQTNTLAYYLPLILILGSIFGIAIYFYTKSKQKTKIKL